MLPQLKRFLDGGDPEIRGLKGQLQVIVGPFKKDQDVHKLLQQIVQFQRKQTSVQFLLSEVGEQEIPEGVNLRLAWLVWKKILFNRKTLENLATKLLSCIIESYQRIPNQVKFVVRCFVQETQKKFGSLRFQDLKSFFNKAIFSQLFFSQFMALYQRKSFKSSTTNLTLLALISQKIMFGQQFYQKFKFGFINSTINNYLPTIRQFILAFASQSIRSPPDKFIKVMLCSFESLETILSVSRKQLPPLPALLDTLGNASCHIIAGKNYPHRNILSAWCRDWEQAMFHSQTCLQNKKTIIQFLLGIDKISQKKSLKTLIEQYRCFQQDISNTKPSVQLYAIYLQQAIAPGTMPGLIEQIMISIEDGQNKIQEVKIGLQKQQNYSSNLEKMYMNLLNTRRAKQSKYKMSIQINGLMNQIINFNYQIQGNSIIEGAQGKSDKTYKKCLIDIGEAFLSDREGVDGLYHMFWEGAVEELQRGVLPDNMVQNTKSILGQKLYALIKLNSYMSKQDKQLFKQMQKHAFVTLSMLDLPDYQEEEQLILKQSEKLIGQLQKPCCPDHILKIFHEITLVIQNVILITGSASDITADLQIPMMLVVVIRCKLRNLHTLLNFIDKFCSDDIHTSVLGQTLTLIKSVMYLIQEMNHSKLSIPLEQYNQLVINSSFIIVE